MPHYPRYSRTWPVSWSFLLPTPLFPPVRHHLTRSNTTATPFFLETPGILCRRYTATAKEVARLEADIYEVQTLLEQNRSLLRDMTELATTRQGACELRRNALLLRIAPTEVLAHCAALHCCFVFP